MKIVSLKAENYKRLQAIEITPDGNIVKIGGDNGQGKSSILDAIWVALAGRAVAPPKPIRVGEEEAIIELDLGRMKIIRKFKDKDGKITDTVRVESAEGLLYKSPQAVLDALVGQIGFDPLDFSRMKPAEQADELRQLVPLSIDLDEHAELDKEDYAARRDTNRDAEKLRAQLAGIPKIDDIPDELIDTAAIISEISNAGQINAGIVNEEAARENKRQFIQDSTDRASRLRAEANDLDQAAQAAQKELDAMPPIKEKIDITATREKLEDAEKKNAMIARNKQRATLEADLAVLESKSEKFTKDMADRAAARTVALAEAEMPIEGLSFGMDDKGQPIVLYAGVPFEQASDADKIKASTAIAMAANPELRVLRIKDGSLLDAKSMAIIADMAKDQDFQLWMEIVGEGDGVGIILENGLIRQPNADKAQADEEPKAAQGDLLS